MKKNIFAIDLGNKTAKLKSNIVPEFSIPSRYIDDRYIDGSNRFESIAGDFKGDVDVKKYKLVNGDRSYYFGKGINDLGKDQYVRESFGVGKQRYEGQKFKDMLSFSIAELASRTGIQDDIIKAELVLGLPSEDYTRSNIETIVNYAKSQHSVEIDGNTINSKISRVAVIPQPIGTFYNLAFDENGKVNKPDFINQKTAIVDIGGLTKLFDSIFNFTMDTTEREQKETGIWTLYSMILDMLEIDSSIKPSKYRLEKIIREGISNNNTFTLKPNKTANDESIVDITSTVSKAIDLYTEQTIDETTNVFTHLSSVDNLVFTGGGSQILNKNLVKEAFPTTNIMFSDEGEYSNVNGFYKFGLTQLKG